MKRNQDLIVRTMDRYYEIFLNRELTDPQLYITQTPHSKEDSFLCPVRGSYMMVPDPMPDKRIYFIIKSKDHEDLVAAPTQLSLEHIDNFRDMGGYTGAGGKTVKWGYFFRSGALAGLSDLEKSYIDNLNLKHILDYRVPAETARAEDYIPEHTAYHNISAFKIPQKNNPQMKDADMEARLKNITTTEELEELIKEFKAFYHKLPFQNPAYKQMFQFLKSGGVPFIQHCTAGKDRTGTGCAILLLALGVDRETVIGDYLLSAAYRAKRNKRFIERLLENGEIIPEAAAPFYTLLSVEREYIETAFHAIDEAYPNFEDYLSQEYQVTPADLENWQNFYLY